MTNKLALTSGGGGTLYPEDVFAAWTHTGTSATQNIQNGINLAAFGGLVWVKTRSGSQRHSLSDTLRGTNSQIATDLSSLATYTNTDAITAFNSNGFTLGADATGSVNSSGSYASWTFRKALKFFDVVTYTGNGAARTIAHSLGIAPGFIMVKRLDSTGYTFMAYHISAGAGNYFDINQNYAATGDTTVWNNTAPTSGVFSVGTNAFVNASGGSYVAYLFAHDTSIDGIIQCGTYTGNQTSGVNVTLGWEPQFLLIKSNNSSVSWSISDALRAMSLSQTAMLQPDTSTGEIALGGQIQPQPSGFRAFGSSNNYNTNSGVHYYVAIRRPRRFPQVGTSVFAPETHTSPGVASSSNVTCGFPADLFITGVRDSNAASKMWFIDRLRGGGGSVTNLVSSSSQSESAFNLATVLFDRPTNVNIADTNGSWNGTTGQSVLAYGLRRARRFFDVVAYTGTGAAKTESHALDVAPELMIVKARNSNSEGAVYVAGLGATQRLALFATTGSAATATDSTAWNSTAPTSTLFTVGTSGSTNAYADVYIAYLFASLPGVSRVGIYTGNGGTSGSAGTSQTINCGFTTGARFVLIKRTAATGDWYIWDTVRGIVAANDPRLSLNTLAAEVTTDDSLDPDNSGFIVNQLAATNINVTGATYIYLAIA